MYYIQYIYIFLIILTFLTFSAELRSIQNDTARDMIADELGLSPLEKNKFILIVEKAKKESNRTIVCIIFIYLIIIYDVIFILNNF